VHYTICGFFRDKDNGAIVLSLKDLRQSPSMSLGSEPSVAKKCTTVNRSLVLQDATTVKWYSIAQVTEAEMVFNSQELKLDVYPMRRESI